MLLPNYILCEIKHNLNLKFGSNPEKNFRIKEEDDNMTIDKQFNINKKVTNKKRIFT